MNRLLFSFIVPSYGHAIRIQSLQLLSSNLSRQYSSIIRSPSIVNNCNQFIYIVSFSFFQTSLTFCRRFASIPRPKISEVTNSDEWITSSTLSIKQNEKTNSNIIDLTSSSTTTTTPQPFCDPPIKADDIDSKHTFKETEQDVAILPTDLNKNAHVSLRQLCDYYTRLSKKNLTSMIK